MFCFGTGEGVVGDLGGSGGWFILWDLRHGIEQLV